MKPAWVRCACRARPVAALRLGIPGRGAPSSSLATSATSMAASARRGPHRSSMMAFAGDKTMSTDIDNVMVTKAYARWAPVYDLVFGPVFEPGRRAAIAAAERVGGRILEVGVGTGISLPDYERTNKIVGVDLSEPIVRKAREPGQELVLTNGQQH